MSEAEQAPRAPQHPKVLRHHGDERVDEYYWLRERENPEVVSYLEEENAYTKAALEHTEELQSRIFDEIKSRVHETDASAPVPRKEWEYFTRTVEGLQYAIHCRRPRDTPGLPDPAAAPGTSQGEDVLLDENERAKDHDFFTVSGLAASPDQHRLAFSIDVSGGERSALYFRDLEAGKDLTDEVSDTYYGLAWANDSSTVFYVRPDDAMRPFQIWRHTIGAAAADDVLVYTETDDRFYVGVGRTRTGRFIVISSESKLTSEVRLIDADNPSAPPQVVAEREQGVEYHVEHHHDEEHGDRLYILTNDDGAVNFKVLLAASPSATRDTWTEVVAHRDDVRLENVDAFANYLVLSERSGGIERIRVRSLADDSDHEVAMPDEVYSAWVGPNPEFETATLRLGYTSLVAPTRDLAYDVEARSITVLKEQDVPGYDASQFETHREWATAPDGVQVPISIVRPHQSSGADSAPAPLLLYGYGSYEISIDPTFSVSRLSLLQRGMGFAIAHVRGGGELGRRWYDDGKLDHKKNTFTDFIACAEHLVAIGVTHSDHLVARGGSAGGLLMGAIANLKPNQFRAIVAEVPFVDVLTTMLDETLPLTVTEWEEWGNPAASADMYSYMKSYSPYDNVIEQRYPAMLVTAGLNDPRVQYWEPAKWVAKLRTTATGGGPIWLKTELGAGHHGPSGRYETWRDEAFVLACVLDQVGVTT
jgi:oligopeptidase B